MKHKVQIMYLNFQGKNRFSLHIGKTNLCSDLLTVEK